MPGGAALHYSLPRFLAACFALGAILGAAVQTVKEVRHG